MIKKQIIHTFYEISNAVHTTSDLDELYRKIHLSLARIIDVTNFFIALYDEERHSTHFPYFVDEHTSINSDYEHFIEENSPSMSVRVIQTGQPLLIGREEILQYTGKLNKDPRGIVPEAWLGVPLMIRSKVIGVLAVQTYSDPELYTSADVELLNSVSEQIALAIDRKQSEEQLKERELLISTLYQISNAIHTSENLDQLYGKIHESLAKIIDVRNFTIAIYNREKDVLYFRYVVDELELEILKPVEKASCSSSLTYRVIDSGKTLLLSEPEKLELYKKVGGRWIGKASAKTWLGVPLRGKNDILGAVVIQNYFVENCYESKEVKLLESVCDQITFAIEKKRAEKDLELTQQELIVKAHKAGMADIASDALHNIGNILNSVKTSGEIIHDTLQHSCSEGLNKAWTLLKENDDDLKGFISNDPSGEKLIRYLLSIEKPFNAELDQIKEHTLRLREKISLITSVIHAQLDYASGEYLADKLPLQEILDDVLAMHRDSLKHAGIALNLDYQENSRLPVQRVKLTHVLTNLIQNAIDSVLAADPAEKQITITLYEEAGNAFLKITDSGKGIEKSNLSRIFTHGYTTKEGGHGFGLHNCANFMTEMKGSIWAESEGLNKGASFTLQFSQF
jgi:signal transduction histidine kinase